ncbi:GIP [Symbiodinium sp. CCMP2592]|nr:GIP [Symbiodinium sp. CCMP2592]
MAEEVVPAEGEEEALQNEVEIAVYKATCITGPGLKNPWLPSVQTVAGVEFLKLSKWDREFVQFCTGRALNLHQAGVKPVHSINVEFFRDLAELRVQACNAAVRKVIIEACEAENKEKPAKIRLAQQQDEFLVGSSVSVEVPAIHDSDQAVIEEPRSLRLLWAIRGDLWMELTEGNLRYVRKAVRNSPVLPVKPKRAKSKVPAVRSVIMDAHANRSKRLINEVKQEEMEAEPEEEYLENKYGVETVGWSKEEEEEWWSHTEEADDKSWAAWYEGEEAAAWYKGVKYEAKQENKWGDRGRDDSMASSSDGSCKGHYVEGGWLSANNHFYPSQDLYHDPLWTLLAKVAKLGRVAAVIGGPPTRTWSMTGHRADGPHPLRSPTEPFGLSTLTSDERDLVDRDTGLYARMLWLHALSTAGRRVHPNPSNGTSMVAFMLEQPSVEHHMASSHSAVGSAPSFWNTALWQAYAEEAGLFEVHFRQGPLGHAGDKPTTVGTNLPDLRDLQALQGEVPQVCSSADNRVSPVWAPGLVQAIVYALQRWPCYRLMKFTQADWEQHVANNHVPYRRDCAVCVHGAGNGRRHHGVVHPDVYCMSADIAGPIRVKGKDPESRNHRPATFKYFLAVSYRFPRLRGVKEESDPSQTEGFDDAALLPAHPSLQMRPFPQQKEEHTPPPRRVRGKRSAGVRLDDVFALDPPPPLPPPAEAPHPEGPVSPVEEESARVARLSLQDLEGLATELIEDDWDLDEALWVLAEVCRAAPQLQHKAGLYRHGGVVGVLGGTTDKPWLTELMNMVLSAVAPTAEYTSLWLSNSTVQPVHADHHNLQGSTNVVLPLKLPPNGGDLWIELKPGDLVSGPVEERVDGKGRRWLGTTHKLERGKPFFLDPTRRHATTPWKGERAVLVGYTVNTLGKELEHEFQSLEALGFPLPASVRLPLTEQQDVRRLDAFDCFEEEPLQETKARHPDGKTSELAPGTVLKGGGWKETQAVEAGTVELEVSWNLKHSPDHRRTQSEHALLACQPDTETQVEEEESSSEDSLPEQPVLWELWVPDPQTGEQLCVLRSDDSDASEACALCKSEPVYTTNVELLLDGLQEPLQVVHTVDPRDAEQCIEKWMPSIHKEIGVIEKAVRRLPPAEGDAALATRKGQAYHKRKARLVACGNHAYSETQAVGTGTVAQQDLQLSAFAVLLAFFQVVGAASQTTDEEEDLSLPVSLDADLMLAVSIICIGICFIAVWEFFKWCLQGVISRREAGTPVLSLSPRKARKLQRLRDQTAQAIQAEISAREEAASSQSVAAAPRRRPSQTTRTREQAGGAPTRYFATPEGTKLHRTKTCSTLAHSHRFVEFQVCQQGGQKEQAKRVKAANEKVQMQALHIQQLGSALAAMNRMTAILDRSVQ